MGDSCFDRVECTHVTRDTILSYLVIGVSDHSFGTHKSTLSELRLQLQIWPYPVLHECMVALQLTFAVSRRTGTYQEFTVILSVVFDKVHGCLLS